MAEKKSINKKVEKTAEKKSAKSSKQSILVIEDDRFLNKIYSTKLTKEGYDVYVAIDGKEGYRKALEYKPDLVLLDLILPGMSGFEVLTKIRRNKEIVDLPVIILSNLGQEEDKERGKNLGVIDYLVKSNLSIDEVMQKIRDTLIKVKRKQN